MQRSQWNGGRLLSGTGCLANRDVDCSGGNCRSGREGGGGGGDWCSTVVQVGSDVPNLPICIIECASGTDNVVVDLVGHELARLTKTTSEVILTQEPVAVWQVD